MNFGDRLAHAVERRQSNLCVGLDPRMELLPPALLASLRPGRAGRARAYERFCAMVVEAVRDEAVAVKPQIAFFEALGGHGLSALERVCALARDAGLLVIADAKRGDIGSTASAYAEAWVRPRDGEPPVADAVTVNPYLGRDSLAPFLAACAEGAGLFVVVHTSNPGASDLQSLTVGSDGADRAEPLWERVARLVAELGAAYVGSSGLSAVGAVMGATRPHAVERARELMPRTPLLLPGVGVQGGGARTVGAALGAHRAGALVSASRSVIYAWRDGRERPGDWREAVRDAAADVRLSFRG
jgi:orotidine-5'-phosphate decarboxylase